MKNGLESDMSIEEVIRALRPFARAIPKEHWHDWVDYSRPLGGCGAFNPPRLSDYRRACRLVERYDQEHGTDETQ